MSGKRRIGFGACLVAMVLLVSGCVIAPREGYYDRTHHRYYHDRSWHDCRDRGERYCR